MQIRRTLGTLCLSTLAVLATTISIAQPACAEDSVRTRSTFKRTSRPATLTRTAPVNKTKYMRRRTSPSSSGNVVPISQMKMGSVLESEDIADADSDLQGNPDEMSNAQLRAYIRYLMARVHRLERLTGYSRRHNVRMSLNGRVGRLERELAPVIAQQNQKERKRAQARARGRKVREVRDNVRESVQETAGNIGTGVSNAAKQGQKAAKKTTDGISRGIKNGVNQAQETFGNMMPGSN